MMRACRHIAVLLVAGLLSQPPFAAAGTTRGAYRTAGDCDGYPALSLDAGDGLCVGLVADHLGLARGVVAIDSDIFVVDMGGWEGRRGRLLKLADGGRHAPEVLLANLEQPNAVVRGPGRTLYVGLSGQVLQVDPYAASPASATRLIVSGLPKTGRHPLSSLAVGADGALFVNVGSATDNCRPADAPAAGAPLPCPETVEAPPRGAILRFPPRSTPWVAAERPAYARGLRNSMAMTILPDGRLVAAVNARDWIHQADPTLSDASAPNDTLVTVQASADYGWPYCYDHQLPSPEYPSFDCRATRPPDLLLPAHAAPLGMLLYRGDRLRGLRGKLVIGYHGYRTTGHRLVAVALDKDDTPIGRPTDIVAGWDAVAGLRPQGSPVGLVELADGSILITEDHNGTLLRLASPGVRGAASSAPDAPRPARPPRPTPK